VDDRFSWLARTVVVTPSSFLPPGFVSVLSTRTDSASRGCFISAVTLASSVLSDCFLDFRFRCEHTLHFEQRPM
jgi:hypothetical protein